MKAVRERGMSVKQASARYLIPRSTLRDRLSDVGQIEDTAPPKLGPGPVISEDFEEELAERVLFLSKMFYGITSEKLASVAFDFAERQKINHPFNREQGKAGRDWVKGFLARHPEITVRKPENFSMARLEAVNRTNLKKFYDNLAELKGKWQYPPHRIYNVDETGISPVIPGTKILAEKGAKRVGRVSSGEKGKTTTVIGCVNAAGDAVPPMVIFGGRKRLKTELLHGTPIGTTGGVSDNGWVTTELFYKWFEHFVDHVRPSVEKRVLLIMDNHSSHISISLLCEARRCGVDIITLPPHSSHVLQPLDISVYGPFKKAWTRQVQFFHDTHPGQRVTDGDIGELFGRAYDSTVKKNPASVVHGFRAAGISPYNPDEVLSNDALFMHNKVLADVQCTREPTQPDQGLQQPSQEPGRQLSVQEQVEPSQGDHAPARETQAPPQEPEQREPQMPCPRPAQRKRATEKSPVDCVLPLPKVAQKQPGRVHRKKSSIILTSSPVKRALEEAEEKRHARIKLERNNAHCRKQSRPAKTLISQQTHACTVEKVFLGATNCGCSVVHVAAGRMRCAAMAQERKGSCVTCTVARCGRQERILCVATALIWFVSLEQRAACFCM